MLHDQPTAKHRIDIADEHDDGPARPIPAIVERLDGGRGRGFERLAIADRRAIGERLPGEEGGTNQVAELDLRAGLLELLGEHHRPFGRSEEQPSELQSLMRISYAVFCLKK